MHTITIIYAVIKYLICIISVCTFANTWCHFLHSFFSCLCLYCFINKTHYNLYNTNFLRLIAKLVILTYINYSLTLDRIQSVF